jgi:translin
MKNLDNVAESIRSVLEAKNRARESAIESSRVLVRHCGNAIRAMHRKEWDNALSLLQTARDVLDKMRESVKNYPDLYFAGYTQDSFKEYVEANLVYAMLRQDVLPTPQDLHIEEATYLNGMAEAASELRRYILDIIRHDHNEEAEQLLIVMESVYDLLVTFDFPDALSGGLRHRTDNLRGVLEKTRGDVTSSLRQQRLEKALAQVEDSTTPNLPRLPKGSQGRV